MADYTNQVLSLLKTQGYYFIRYGKGSYSTWFSPISGNSWESPHAEARRRRSSFRAAAGVYNNGGTFTKTRCVIYGDTDNTHTADSTENTVLSGYCHAVFSIVSDTSRKRNSTAGTGMNMDSDTLDNWE
jgi:hypothetical protein